MLKFICNQKINAYNAFKVIYGHVWSGEQFVSLCIRSQLRSNKVRVCPVSAVTGRWPKDGEGSSSKKQEALCGHWTELESQLWYLLLGWPQASHFNTSKPHFLFHKRHNLPQVLKKIYDYNLGNVCVHTHVYTHTQLIHCSYGLQVTLTLN